MRKLYTLPLSILGILFFFLNPIFGQVKPVANDDKFDIGYEGCKTTVLELSKNDLFPGLGKVSFKMIKQPKVIRVFFDEYNGSTTYLMSYVFRGLDSFQYVIHEPIKNIYDTATVILNVDPRWSWNYDLNSSPVRIGIQAFELNGHSSLHVYKDTLDNYTIDIVKMPKKGTMKRLNAQLFEYIPNINADGTDSVTYRACDKSYNYCKDFPVSVKLVNKPPTAVDDYITVHYNTEEYFHNEIWKNDYDPDNDIVHHEILGSTASSTLVFGEYGDLTYKPALNFNGQDTVTYRICDLKGLCDTGKVYVTVLPASPIIAKTATYKIDKLYEEYTFSSSLSYFVAGENVDYSTLTYKIIAQPKEGNAVVTNSDEFTYNLNNKNF